MWREPSLAPVAVTFQNSWPGGTEGLKSLSKAVVIQSLSRVWLFATPWTVALQALSMGFSRQEYWSLGNCSLLQQIFPTQGLNPGLLHCRQVPSLSHQGCPHWRSYREQFQPSVAKQKPEGKINAKCLGPRDHAFLNREETQRRETLSD